MRADPTIRFSDPARSNAAVRSGGSTVIDHAESEEARSPRSAAGTLGFGFRRPILVRLYQRVSNLWLLLTLASGVVAATGLTFESVLVAGIGLALMFAAMLGLSTDLRRSRPEIARGSACRSGGAGCWAWRLADGTAWYDQCFQRLIGDPIGPTILQAGLFETLLGRIHADDLAQFHFAVDATIEGGADLDCTVRLRTPDGEWRAIRFIGGCDAGSAGESDCINGIALPEDRDRIASSLASRTGDDLLCALSDQAKLTRDLERIRVRSRRAEPAVGGSEGRGRRSDASQERIPRQHEPRDSDSPDRDHRLRRSAGGRPGRPRLEAVDVGDGSTKRRAPPRAGQYSALIPLLQRQVLCVDTTASTPSTLR